MKDGPAVLAIEHLSKTFPGQVALRDVSLDVRPGEIHALVGENGSGKSTLIKCLAGYHQSDEGAVIRVMGDPLPEHFGPDVAAARGLVFVHQDLGLIPTLSVMENLALSVGFAKRRGGRIDWRAQKRRAAELLRSTGHAIAPSTLVGSLSRADQTLVALARVLSVESGVKLAIFDEPTASLTPDEVPRLFRAIRHMAAEGAGVIYVSHRLEEILELADRVTVLRDGHRVVTAPTAGMAKSELVRYIVGDEAAQSIARAQQAESVTVAGDSEIVLRATALEGPGVGPVTFELRRGEILGIAGLLGAGRTELAQLLFGASPRSGGSVELSGRPLALRSPADAIRAGIALVPEDRLGQGTFPTLSVRENAVMLRLRSMWSGLRLSSRREATATRELISDFNVRPADGKRALALLSGGNQQKVVLGKWINQSPKVLILDEPMQGIDIGAKSEVAQIIRRSAAAGMSVILIDSDFEHFMELSDRILVLSRGTQTATLAGQQITRDRVMEMAFHVPEAHDEEDAVHA